MHRLTKRLPSPSMAVAFVALLAALGGTAVALPGKNSVDSGDLKKGAVKVADIAKNAVTGAKVKNGTIGSGDVANNSLTGSDVNEGTLGQVPSAASAGNANTANSAKTAGNADTVGGVSVRSFKFAAPGVAPTATILDLGGLQLQASCSGATLSFDAISTVADAQLNSYSVEMDDTAPPPNHNLVDIEGTLAGASIDLVPDDEDDEVGHLRFTRPDGGGVIVEWAAVGDIPATGCFVNGVASAF